MKVTRAELSPPVVIELSRGEAISLMELLFELDSGDIFKLDLEERHRDVCSDLYTNLDLFCKGVK